MTNRPVHPRTIRTCMVSSRTSQAPAQPAWRRQLAAMWIGAGPGEPIDAPAAARAFALFYGVVCYAAFFLTYLYAVGFIGGFLVPTTLDGPRTGPLWLAVSINVGLLLLFAVQHSVMARPWFKRWWTRFVPTHLERSTYTLFSSLALVAMFILWRPMGGVVWDIQHPVARGVLYALLGAGFLIVLVTTFLINHFDLFGLRQTWLYFRGRAYTYLQFGTPGPYRIVRHPLYVGWLLAFWATPTMTAAHLLFAVITTLYILAAIRWEERDLIALHPEYESYREQVPMLVPTPGRAWRDPEGADPAMA